MTQALISAVREFYRSHRSDLYHGRVVAILPNKSWPEVRCCPGFVPVSEYGSRLPLVGCEIGSIENASCLLISDEYYIYDGCLTIDGVTITLLGGAEFKRLRDFHRGLMEIFEDD